MTDKKIQADQKIQYDIYRPFGPSILKVRMPQGFVNLLNAEADRILNDEKLSKERDWSHNLAGNVRKELAKLEALHEKENDIVERINDIIDDEQFDHVEDFEWK